MRVFPKPIVLNTKPRIDAYVLFTSKLDLVVKTIALGKTRISAISSRDCREADSREIIHRHACLGVISRKIWLHFFVIYIYM